MPCALPGENDGGVPPVRAGWRDEGDDARRGAAGADERCVRASAAESGVRALVGRAGRPGVRASS
ncbi:hypothetical protein [Cellulomonas persica]|uniref:hypothetical protein n=1 Tax=Cellulomonas persica TaxID=76861 RepID=UPI0011BD91E0|nr:hypothetical protein [Cellulomonas persica]